ncbi:HAD family hydrolase [Dietzia timorensis]|uniref:Putative HAD-hydrolase n=1 Tax=Dietzia timorensis TaxID=499555 RepID=A0A173LG90_9ACTN|nr:HAD family hydrolase [Dietzia timorensis]ANI90883.1 putative HAD-hydrolase [Dietzia timorensis]
MDQQLPGRVRVVVFDVGETLIDESRLWAQQAHTVGVSPFTLMGVIGALIEQQESHHKAWDILGVEAPSAATEIRPGDFYPDALDCLLAARDTGFVVGIAGNQLAGATSCLRAGGFDADFIASAAKWGVAKPSTSFFSLIADASGAEPGEILYVGDRLDNDIIPAAVGFRTALLRRGPWGQIHSRHVDSSLADLRLDSLTELASIFRAATSGAPAEQPANELRRDDPAIRTVRASDADRPSYR